MLRGNILLEFKRKHKPAKRVKTFFVKHGSMEMWQCLETYTLASGRGGTVWYKKTMA
jgi:hypothetical protein